MDLQNKVITISGEETKKAGNSFVKKIKDENNLTYSFFQTKSDGSETAAWSQYKQLAIGDTVQIGYVEEQKEYQGKAYTQRTIRNFNKDIGNGVKNHQATQTTAQPKSEPTNDYTHNQSLSQPINKDALIIRQVAFKGVIDLVNNGYMKFSQIPQAVSIFEQIIMKQPLSQPDKFFLEGKAMQQTATVKPAPDAYKFNVAPDIQEIADEMASEEEDVNVDNIPF